MRAIRDGGGTWRIEAEHGEQHLSEGYANRLLRCLQCLDPAFERACDRCEFETLLALRGVRGLSDAGWDPYETTAAAIKSMTKLHENVTDFETARHLQLWIYGHLVEASEPYEVIANLIDIGRGGRFMLDRFPPVGRSGRPQTPGEKIQKIGTLATGAGIPSVAVPLREMWNRDLRNAIFHAEYALFGSDVRILRPYPRSIVNAQTLELVNCAHAFHTAMTILIGSVIGSYSEPETIPVHPGFSSDPEERAIVIVREGHGAIGLKDAWTAEQIRAGHIPYCVGRFLPNEWRAREADHSIAFFPKRTSGGERAEWKEQNAPARSLGSPTTQESQLQPTDEENDGEPR